MKLKDEVLQQEPEAVMQQAVDLMNSTRDDWFEDFQIVAERGRRILLANERDDNAASMN